MRTLWWLEKAGLPALTMRALSTAVISALSVLPRR
jgi:hypothetical protein